MCERYFYRCIDCLTVMAAETRENDARCGLCGGQIEFMGRVERDRLVTSAMESVCDSRCTSALGPKCNCKCGGCNHGSGRVVKVDYDHGPRPVLQAPNSLKAKTVAREWKAAEAAIVAQIEPILARKRTMRWLDEHDYGQLCKLQKALRDARGNRTHGPRMKRLAPYLPAVEPVTVGEFALANDRPRVLPQSFDSLERTAQRPLVDGLQCLPGQLDLF